MLRGMTNATAMHYKALPLTLKSAPGEDGVFEGYASVFGVVDQGLDVVERGAFAKSLGSRKVKIPSSTTIRPGGPGGWPPPSSRAR